MARKVQQFSLETIDEVLNNEDPKFMEQLSELKAEHLNGQEIQSAISPDGSPAIKRSYKQYWTSLEGWQRIVIIYVGFIAFVAGPIVYLSLKGFFTPQFSFSEIQSLEEYSDQIIQIDLIAKEKDLINIFPFEEHIFKIEEQVVNLLPKDNIRFGHFSFAIEVQTAEDLAYMEQYQAQVLDIISGELRKVDYTSFDKAEGKRQMRQTLLNALQAKMGDKVVNLYYDLAVFNQ